MGKYIIRNNNSKPTYKLLSFASYCLIFLTKKCCDPLGLEVNLTPRTKGLRGQGNLEQKIF